MRTDVKLDTRLQRFLGDKRESIEPRVVRFTGNVKEDSAEKFCIALAKADAEAQGLGQKVLPVIINSYGGVVYDCFTMLQAIKECRSEVVTVVQDKAMSAGAVLFSAGKRRYITPYATVMVHSVSGASWGKIEEVRESTKHMEHLNERLFDVLDTNTDNPAGYWKERMAEVDHADLFLTAEDCLKHRLATKIGAPSLVTSCSFTVDFVDV